MIGLGIGISAVLLRRIGGAIVDLGNIADIHWNGADWFWNGADMSWSQ